MEKESEKEQNKNVIGVGASLLYGLCLGLAFYLMFGNLILDICIGLCLSLLFNQSNRDK